MKNKILCFALAGLLCGCVGPLISQESARTVGAQNSEILAGYGMAGYLVKYSYGLLDDLDLAVQLESLAWGFRAKYAFLNNQQHGWSSAIAAGIGESIGGSHVYGDLMGSYLFGVAEPYGTVRIVHVTIDPITYHDQSGSSEFNVNVGSYNYGELIVGSRFWLSKHWLFSIEAATLFAMTSQVTFTNAFLANAAFGYRF